jgi:hypothetical protein
LILALAVVVLFGGPGNAVTARIDTAGQDQVLTIRQLPESGNRPLVRITSLLADSSLEHAARSGLPLRVRVRVELWRDGLIDDLVASEGWTSVLVYEPLGREYIVRPNPRPGTALRFNAYAAARQAIEREYLLDIRPTRSGRYYYTATLELETLSLSDLEELERWLQGELGPAVSGDRSLPGAVGQGAKRLMIRLLGMPTRRIEARSNRFEF